MRPRIIPTAPIPPRRGVACRRKGGTLVEFALVAPILFAVVLACIEFTRMNMMESMADDAAYEAARNVIVPGATKDEARAVAQGVLNAIGTRNATITVQAFDGTTEQTQVDEDTTRVSVTVEIPIADNSLFIPRFFTTESIVKTAQLITERYNGYYDGGT